MMCRELTELKEKLAAARILLQSQQQAIEKRDKTVQVPGLPYRCDHYKLILTGIHHRRVAADVSEDVVPTAGCSGKQKARCPK